MAGDNVPETRKQMINLMYLVLTALLALNVTREVLNAFSKMDESITRSNESIVRKNDQVYKMFAKEMLTADSTKTKPWYEKALSVKAQSASLVNYIQMWKDSLIATSGGYAVNEEGDSIYRGMDNINSAYDLFVNKKHGPQLRDSMKSYVSNTLALVSDPDKHKTMNDQFPLEIKPTPKTEDNPSGSWSYATFHHIPVVAGVAMLSKFQNDVRNSEAMLLDYFQSQIHAQDYKFDALQPIAVPNTTYALAGQKISATILLAAYNKEAKGLSITSSAGPVKIEDGAGQLQFTASGTGLHTVNGVISIKKAGKSEKYPYKFQYMVGSAGASLQLDKMNVMYIGVDNPITVSASGYNIEDVSLAWSAGSGVKMKASKEGKGHYVANVSKPGTVDYKIMAKRPEGGSTQISSGKIRIKRIPDPVPEVGQKTGGLISTSSAKAQMGVYAALKNFDFEARFKVLSFTFIWIPQNGQAKISQNEGASWNNTVQEFVKRSRPGDKWVINNIKAVGPDHETRTLSSVVLTLN